MANCMWTKRRNRMTSTVIASNSLTWEQLKYVFFRSLNTVRSINVFALSHSISFLPQLETFVCFVQEVAKFNYYPYGLTVSCVFLGITLIVYLCLPKVSTHLADQIPSFNRCNWYLCVCTILATQFAWQNIGVLRDRIADGLHRPSGCAISLKLEIGKMLWSRWDGT